MNMKLLCKPYSVIMKKLILKILVLERFPNIEIYFRIYPHAKFSMYILGLDFCTEGYRKATGLELNLRRGEI